MFNGNRGVRSLDSCAMNVPVGRVNEFHFTNRYKWVRIALFGCDIEKDTRKFWKWIMCNKNAGGGRKKVTEKWRTILNYKLYQHQQTVHLLVLIKCIIIFKMYQMYNIKKNIYIYSNFCFLSICSTLLYYCR
jgi:hypothetical protein